MPNVYLSRTWRGPTVFAFNKGGVTNAAIPSGTYDASKPNTWIWSKLTGIPQDATHVLLEGMAVGGVGGTNGANFFLHVDFNDPNNWASMPAPENWTSSGGQGEFYTSFNSPNERYYLGQRWVPLNTIEWLPEKWILVRWKVDGDYNNPMGVNFWVKGYAV